MKNKVFVLISFLLSLTISSCSKSENSYFIDSQIEKSSSFCSSLNNNTSADYSSYMSSETKSSNSESISSYSSNDESINHSSSVEEIKSYTVTWLNDDGTILEIDENVIEGDIPYYDGSTPTKEDNEHYSFSFAGWNKKIEAINNDETYIATYNPIPILPNTNKVVWVFNKTIKTERYRKGSLPYYGDINNPCFFSGGISQYFLGWDKEIETVFEDTTYTALFSSDQPKQTPINSPFIFYYNSDDHSTCRIYDYRGNKEDLIIPDYDGDVLINTISAIRSDSVKTITIGKYIKDIGNLNGTNIEKIIVSEENPYFATQNGVLYNKDFTELVKCPTSFKGELVIPETVKMIRENALNFSKNITSIVFPNGIISTIKIGFSEVASVNIHCSINTWLSVDRDTSLTNCHLFLDGENEEATSFSFPSNITEIADCVLLGCSALTSVYIPDGVVSIGHNAFEGCSSLISINIPDSVVSIGHEAFRDCSSLANIEIPNRCQTIEYRAFYGCSALTSVYIPDSLTNLGYNVFDECVSLSSIYIGKNVYFDKIDYQVLPINYLKEINVSLDDINYTSIDGVLYSKDLKTLIMCPRKKEGKLIIPDSVTSIMPNALYGCAVLTEVTLPKDFKSIDRATFYGCSSLTSIDIPDSVTSIADYAFYGCSMLTNINIPDGITIIGESLFAGCSSLASIDIPDSVTAIGYKAFFGCSKLTNIDIPNHVNKISGYTFASCSSLKSIKIPDSVTTIDMGAFSGCSSLTSVTIGNSVTSIGEKVFDGCSSLEFISIGDNAASISGAAFHSCSSLLNIDVSSNNVSYSSLDGVLYDKNKATLIKCPNSKTSITIPDSVTSIADFAFYGCSKLTNIDIPDGVNSIGREAFRNCSSLINIDIPDNVNAIGSSAFYDCSSLTNIDLSNNITTISSCTFYGCSMLTNIDIPDSVTTIDMGAFSGCSSLSSMIIPDSVTSISYSAFKGCSSLTSIIIPNSVIKILSSDFIKDCSSLNTIYYQGTLDQWAKLNLNIDLSIVYFYSEIKPDRQGNYWHYVDEVPTIW